MKDFPVQKAFGRAWPILFFPCLLGCEDDDTLDPFEEVVSCSAEPSIHRTPLSDTPLPLPFSISAVIARQDGAQPEDVTSAVEWSSMDPRISEYDSTRGAFLLKADGQVDVEGLYDPRPTGGTDRVGSCTVRVKLVILPKPPPKPTVEIDPPSLALAAGTTRQLRAYRVQEGMTDEVTGQVEWAVAVPERASVSNVQASKGLLTTLSPGSTQVSATLDGATAFAALTVTAKPIEGLEFRPNPLTVREGAEVTVRLYARQEGVWNPLPNPYCTALSGSAGIFSATPDGGVCRIRGLSPGMGSIQAEAGGLTAQAAVTVERYRIESLEVTPDRVDLRVGESFSLTCTAIYTDGRRASVSGDPQVRWSTSDRTVINTVTAGAGRADGEGTANVTCARDSLQASAAVTVTPPGPRRCRINPAVVSLQVNQTQDLKLYCEYTDNTTHERTTPASWSSSDVSKITVDTQGVATGVAESTGPVTITARFETLTATAAVTVIGEPVRELRCDPASYTLGVSSQFVITPELVLVSGRRVAPTAGSVTYVVTSTAITVSPQGLVRAASPGSPVITCTHRPSGLTSQVFVTVIRSCANPQFDGSFSAGLGLWGVGGAQWQVGTPSNVGPTECYTPPHCAGTVLDGNAYCRQTSDLFSRRFTICSLSPGETTIQLRWWEWFSFGSGGPLRGRFFLQEWDRDRRAWGGNLINGVTVSSGWSGDQWVANRSIDLTAFAGRTVRLYFRYSAGNNACRGGPGWYIDEVEVIAY